MDRPIAFLNGRFLPADQLAVSPEDAGFVLGITLAEQLRTFGGRLADLAAHRDRLQAGLEWLGWEGLVDLEALGAAAEHLVEVNFPLVDPADDLGVTLFVTPGAYPAYRPEGPGEPTAGAHTYRLPFRLWAGQYASGQHLVISDTAHITPRHWPASLKCRSRMHYYLADRQARQRDPKARALLLTLDGWVTETSTANLLAYSQQEGLISPPLDQILPGISLQHAMRLAGELGVATCYRSLKADELFGMQELMTTSTPYCILPVVQLDGRTIGDGRPGPLFRALLERWSLQAGVDIAGQAGRWLT